MAEHCECGLKLRETRCDIKVTKRPCLHPPDKRPFGVRIRPKGDWAMAQLVGDFQARERVEKGYPILTDRELAEYTRWQ